MSSVECPACGEDMRPVERDDGLHCPCCEVRIRFEPED